MPRGVMINAPFPSCSDGMFDLCAPSTMAMRPGLPYRRGYCPAAGAIPSGGVTDIDRCTLPSCSFIFGAHWRPVLGVHVVFRSPCLFLRRRRAHGQVLSPTSSRSSPPSESLASVTTCCQVGFAVEKGWQAMMYMIRLPTPCLRYRVPPQAIRVGMVMVALGSLPMCETKEESSDGTNEAVSLCTRSGKG